MKFLGVELSWADRGQQFLQVSDGLALGNNLSASLDGDRRRLALFDGEWLIVLSRNDEGRWLESARRSFDVRTPGLVGIGGASVLLALRDGRVMHLDAQTLKTRGEYQPEGGNMPRSIEGAPDGSRFAVVFHHRRAWLFDAVAGAPDERRLPHQRDISAVKFFAGGRLVAADHFDRLIEYDVETLREIRRFEPRPTTFESIYWNVLSPIYRIFPKPGEMQNLVSYLLTEDESVATGPDQDDMTGPRMKIDIQGPIWSNLGFLAVVLTIACLYVARSDF
jgi:hypothetical protein